MVLLQKKKFRKNVQKTYANKKEISKEDYLEVISEYEGKLKSQRKNNDNI